MLFFIPLVIRFLPLVCLFCEQTRRSIIGTSQPKENPWGSLPNSLSIRTKPPGILTFDYYSY